MDSTQRQKRVELWNKVPIPERVARRAVENIDADDNGCWISLYSSASHGYAQIGWSHQGKTYAVLAHRAAWVHFNGQVPLGMTIDHICKVRKCVNPDHLRLLPNFENARRVNGMDWPMGQCANGHPNTSLRLIKNRSGVRRICSECKNLYAARERWQRHNPGVTMPDELLLTRERSKLEASRG